MNQDAHRQDVGELGVAEVGDNLGGGVSHHGGQAEGAHCPAQVGLPPGALQGQTLAQGWLVHLRIAWLLSNKCSGMCSLLGMLILEQDD